MLGVAEEEVAKPDTESHVESSRLFVFSAQDTKSLEISIAAMVKYLLTQPLLRDAAFLKNLSYTLCCRRSLFPRRLAVAASTSLELIAQLQNPPSSGRLGLSVKPVFVFTGQGAQWPSMGMELMRFEVFAETMHRAALILEQLGTPWSLIGMFNLTQIDLNVA